MTHIWITALITAADLCIKEEIESRDSSEFPMELEGAGGKIILHKSHNTGLPFQVLKDRPGLVRMFPIITISGLCGIMGFLLPRKGYQAEKLALSLTLGGAFSNLYDRIKRNYVVDYFSINVGKLKKVIFNLGDICIFAGAAVLVSGQLAQEALYMVKKMKGRKKA